MTSESEETPNFNLSLAIFLIYAGGKLIVLSMLFLPIPSHLFNLTSLEGKLIVKNLKLTLTVINMKLTDAEVKLLRLLQEEGRIRYSDLLEKMKMSTSGLSKMLKRLQERGLIKRIQESTSYPPPVYYELTEEGEKVLRLTEFTTILFSPKLSEEDRKAVEELIQRLKKKYQL